ncbi:DUF885 domain-containing protein [Hymenobacter sp. BT770]|uniref:DUF885 domain-containing protein n=1 Tax=Hymenobacter sp. BT770 TaxID=2886942 RepID=UPI001D1245C1|nr:DUF885 domain-containing protein [Hymenobacter sp. BT770]MCC3154254.1 DUF885 domain-containing protein [Hymenobacter sp. BT770]MDO3416366.1 DUF885 domain-containing protein [Hymenobacter sp. BT770]
MKKLALAGLVAAALTTACNQTKTTENATATGQPAGTEAAADTTTGLQGLFNSYWEKQLRLDPMSATAYGDNRYNNILPNNQTRAFRDTLHAFYQNYLTRLQQFDREKLNDNDKISYDIFAYEMNHGLAGLKLNTWMMPANQFYGLPITMGQYGSGQGNQPFKTVKDYDNWLGRVHGFTAWTDSAIGNFRVGMRRGVVLPRALVVRMIPQLQAPDILVTDPTKSLYYGPISRFPKNFSDADKTRITDAYKKAILTELVPAYRKLGTFLQQEYLPKARTTSGIDAVPGGKEIYAYDVKYETTTDKTPAEIYQIGLSEVARIRAQMEQIKSEVGFKGDLQAFFKYLNTDPKFRPFKTPQEVLAAFENIHQRMLPNLKKMFGRTPKTPFEIRETEKFREASASAEYNQGSPDGSRPGIFYVPIPDATTFATTSGMESLFLHEAIPGHHYQISLQQENTSLPKFRRFGGQNAYVEGWALYCESLGPELGLFKDPYQRMGALGDEMLRAVRLVVDTGLHSRHMTREQAIEYLLANLSTTRDEATSAIERYMAIPGQALGYKIGQLKIRELRAKYEKQLGPKFKLSDFHDELLKDGSMPLAVLEKKMDAWAAKQ